MVGPAVTDGLAGTGAARANLDKGAIRRAVARRGDFVGRFREQLIHLVAVLVAVNLAAAVVALDARIDKGPSITSEARRASNAARSAGESGAATATLAGGVLTGGSLGQRRHSSGQVTTGAPQATGATGATGTTAPAPSPTVTNPPTRPPAASTAGSSPSRARSTAPTAGQPTTTATAGNRSAGPPPPPTATPAPSPAPDSPPSSSAPPADEPATGSTSPPKAATPSYSSGVWTVTDDPTGDTFLDDSSRAPQANPRADIVQSRATNTTKAIGLAVKVAQPADPTRDPTWNSTATFVLWEVDTNGDGNPDFEVEYFVEGGKLFAGVSRGSGNARQAACEAEAGYTSESYLVGIDPACLGSPASLSYRATVYYAADPNNQNSASITDVSPDGGMTGPMRRSAA
jgi:hypothetical protein